MGVETPRLMIEVYLEEQNEKLDRIIELLTHLLLCCRSSDTQLDEFHRRTEEAKER